MYQIYICPYFFILQNTNSCIIYIINEIPKIFWMMQSFYVTVKNRCIFCITPIFIRSDWTCTFLDSIIYCYYNNVLYPGLSFYSRYCSHPNKISHTWGIFYLIHFCIFRPSSRELSIQFMFVGVFTNTRGRIDDRIF